MRPVISIVTAAYNEAANLPVLYQRLTEVLGSLGVTWEWVIVDDHSRDGTFDVIRRIAATDPHVRGMRLARNSGAHLALTCGLNHCSGDCAVTMAADLQDPPETVVPLLEKWRTGAQVVWAARAQREGEKASTILFARFYYWIMRAVVGLREIPPTGADLFLLDRRVIDAFRDFQESNISMLALITWMGFRQDSIEYVKQARLHGASGWTLKKKLKLVVDSVTSFTYLPIRMMSYLGFCVALLGFLYAAFVAIHALSGHPIQGWSSLMVAVLIIGGFQILFMGVLGEYIWRTLDETRRRPRFLIEDATPRSESANQSGS
ncbi:MAG TPA: glycosyltransferase family 2 protein [Bryobacteraceae bacterium]|nr:glycosyltransferase family 2 protein [Bryobacteraceae bacterium]